MPRPIKVNYNGSLFDGFKEMSDTDLDTVADLILDEFTDNPTTTGHLVVNSQSGWTDVGTFVDTYRDDAVGAHPASTTINSENYVFRQNQSGVTPNVSARPLHVKYNGSDMEGLIEQTDTYVVNNIIDRVQLKLASFSQGTYKLQPSAPSGGTWTSKATLSNKHTDHTNDTTQLWLRTDNPTSTIVRPLKWSSSTPPGIKEMTDSEIKELADYFRDQITVTGIGKYQLSASAPSPGTWIQAGSGFTDTRHERTDQNYTGSYADSYSGTYTGSYTGSYSGTYHGYFAGSREHSYTGSYTGSYAGTYTGYYSGTYTGYFAGARNHTYTGYYAGSRNHSYTGYYAGSRVNSYGGTYSGAYSRTFAGSYTGSYALYYSGAGPYWFTGSYTGYYTGYFTGYYTGYYDGTYSANYAGSYTGSYGANYAGAYTGSYSGSYSNTFTGAYTGYYSGSRDHSYSGTYTGTYTPGAPNPGVYVGFFAGSRNNTYTGSYTGSYSGARDHTYTGATIMSSHETISTTKLWLRTA